MGHAMPHHSAVVGFGTACSFYMHYSLSISPVRGRLLLISVSNVCNSGMLAFYMPESIIYRELIHNHQVLWDCAGATGDELSSKVVTSTSYEMDGVARDVIRERHVNAPESTSDSVYYCTGTSLVCSTHSGRMKWEIDLSEFSGCRGRPILLEAQAKVRVTTSSGARVCYQINIACEILLFKIEITACFLHYLLNAGCAAIRRLGHPHADSIPSEHISAARNRKDTVPEPL